MEKFAVDLDRVLDEFEYNEDCAEQMARRDRRQYETYSSEEIGCSKSSICSHGELQDEELRESKSLPTEYPTRIVNKDSLLNKKIDERLLHYDVEQRNLNESPPKRHSSKYPNINKTNDALDESKNSLHSKLNVNRVFSCLNEYINTGSVFHINKTNYGYCEENQKDSGNNSSPCCTDDTSISQSTETRRNENQTTDNIACNKSSQQQSSQKYSPCILDQQYEMNNQANDGELLRKTLECLYWHGDADIRSVPPGEESGSQVEVPKTGEILQENSTGESNNEFIPSIELSQQGSCSLEQNKMSEDSIKRGKESKDVSSNMTTEKDPENINRLEVSVFPVVYEDNEVFSDEFLNMYLNSLESCDTYFSLDRITNEGTAGTDVKECLECDIHTIPISPTLSELPSPTYEYTTSSDILVTECPAAQNMASAVDASESTPDGSIHNIVPCTIPNLDFSIPPVGANTTPIATDSSFSSIVTADANPNVSSIASFTPTAIAVTVGTVTTSNSASAVATSVSATSVTNATAAVTATIATTATATTAPAAVTTTTTTTTTTNTTNTTNTNTNTTNTNTTTTAAAATAAAATAAAATAAAVAATSAVAASAAATFTTNTCTAFNTTTDTISAAAAATTTTPTIVTTITTTTAPSLFAPFPTTTTTTAAAATTTTTTTTTINNTVTIAAASTTTNTAAAAAAAAATTTTTTTSTTPTTTSTTAITAAAAITTITAVATVTTPLSTTTTTTTTSATNIAAAPPPPPPPTTTTTTTIITADPVAATDNNTTTTTTTASTGPTVTDAAAASICHPTTSGISTSNTTNMTTSTNTITTKTTTSGNITTATAAAAAATAATTTPAASTIPTSVGTSNTIDANIKNLDEPAPTFDTTKGSSVEPACKNSGTNMNYISGTSTAPIATSFLSSIPLVESADNLHNSSVLNALENCSATTCDVRAVEVSEPSTSSISTELCVSPTSDTFANPAYPLNCNISHQTFEDSSCLSLDNCSGATSVKNQPENAKKESEHFLRDRHSESITDPFVEKMDTAADGLALTLESGISSTAGDDHVLSSPDTSEASSGELTLQNILASEVENSSNEVGCTSDEHKLGRIPPMWVPDDKAPTCMLCCCKFTVLKRRHHCRACGKVFCSKCCCMKYRLDYLNYAEVRVCLLCHDILVRDADEENDSLKGLSDASSSNSNSVTSTGRKPNPNNPMEYCSTIPPLEQAANALSHPVPSVLVPVGVLKREGSARLKSDVAKQVIFSDGIRPGGDLTEVETSSEQRILRQTDVTVKRVSNLSGLLYSTVRLSRSFDVKAKSFISNDGLPPLAVMDKGNLNLEDIPFRNMTHFLTSLKCETNSPAVFALNKNLFVKVKILNLDCCVNRVCWCFSTEGMSCVSQDEIVIILECLPEDNSVPTDIFHFLNSLYHDATKGILISEMGHTIFKNSLFLGSSDHGGFLYIRPSFQCLHKIILPSAPYLVGILIHRWEIPWAKLFPIRLMLRLGAEFRYYPCMLVSIQQREPVYCEIGHTIMNLLADFRNMSYTLPSIPGMVIHMEDKHTSILLPKNRYDQVSRALNNSNDHVLALAANFSLDADSHLVCIQSPSDDSYHTQAINIHNKPRKVTGASFVVFNGALKISSNLLAKSTIVEDGLMVQITPDMIQELRSSLHKMKNFIVRCGPSSATAPDELVEITWIEEDRNFNLGVRSIIDGFVLDGVPSIRVHNGSDFMGKTRFIRWTEVFILQPGNVGDGMIVASDTIDVSHIAESLAAATCMALCDFLDLLAQSGFTRLAVRANIHQENVGYAVGSRGEKLPPIYMKSLDSTLVPVLHNTASAISNSSPIVLELIFHIMLQ